MLIDELNFKNQNFERNIEYRRKISNFYAIKKNFIYYLLDQVNRSYFYFKFVISILPLSSATACNFHQIKKWNFAARNCSNDS